MSVTLKFFLLKDFQCTINQLFISDLTSNRLSQRSQQLTKKKHTLQNQGPPPLLPELLTYLWGRLTEGAEGSYSRNVSGETSVHEPSPRYELSTKVSTSEILFENFSIKDTTFTISSEGR